MALVVLRHLDDGSPVVIADAESAADRHLVIDPVGQAKARTDVVFAARQDLAA
jgi:hypothetical protein